MILRARASNGSIAFRNKSMLEGIVGSLYVREKIMSNACDNDVQRIVSKNTDLKADALKLIHTSSSIEKCLSKKCLPHIRKRATRNLSNDDLASEFDETMRVCLPQTSNQDACKSWREILLKHKDRIVDEVGLLRTNEGSRKCLLDLYIFLSRPRGYGETIVS